jgi:hypothetical protein
VALDGLASMRPGGPFLSALNAESGGTTTYHAISADFEPRAGALADALKARLADAVVDRVFERAKNDLVVPTEGIAGDIGSPHFPIPTGRLLQFDASRGVSHTSYFEQEESGASLLRWLG